MDIFSIIQLLGGLAFFLYGMSILSSTLENMAGSKLEVLLRQVTDNPFKGLAFGAVVTVAIQSSSALTVMLVGFVNSGIMDLSQTIPVIMCSNIATTLTAWILSLTGISGSNVLIRLMEPANFSLIAALIGAILVMTAKVQKKKDIGHMLLGFAILMTGMTMMSASMSPLADSPAFARLLTAFSNPFVALLISTVLTGIIQSSAATIGMLQALALTGQISIGIAIPIVMGANIGTCVTALLSSVGVNHKAKRVSLVHIFLNVAGTVLWFAVFYPINAFAHFSFLSIAATPLMVAVIHSVFNVAITIILFPFCRQIEKLVCKLIPDAPDDKDTFLDPLLLATPAVAVAESRNAVSRMSDCVRQALDNACEQVRNYTEERASQMTKDEEKIDHYQDHIGSYLLQINQKSPSARDAEEVSHLLLLVNEYERLGDIALKISDVMGGLHEADRSFSAEAQDQMNRLLLAVSDCYKEAIRCDKEDDVEASGLLLPLKQVIEAFAGLLRNEHTRRLAKGICTAEQGLAFNDILTFAERIAGHSVNIAASEIRYAGATEHTGEYMHNLAVRNQTSYRDRYNDFYQKYIGEATHTGLG